MSYRVPLARNPVSRRRRRPPPYASGVPAPPAEPAPLPPTVRALGWASLLNDASSEFLYPFLPAFLTGVLGAGKPVLGLVEGAAEAAATAAKFASGPLAERLGRRRPLVAAGYGLAAISRPLLALAPGWGLALSLRALDRVGKGLRGPPRDALLAAATPAADRGRAFGFRAAMDHTGALAGALLAAGVAALLGAGADLRTLLLWGSIPALLSAVVVLAFVKEPPRPAAPAPSAARTAGPLPPAFRRYLLAAAVFSLGNSSDAFLLLRASDLGVPLAALPLLWAAHHAVKPALAYAVGRRSDRTGRRGFVALGWSAYALVYAGFALADGPVAATVLFVLYGAYHGLAEGVEKALVADLVPEAARDRAFSWFAGLSGLAALPASLGVGFLWALDGPGLAFGAGAALAVVATVLLLVLVPDPARALVG